MPSTQRVPFHVIEKAATARHGAEGVSARLSTPRTATELRELRDDRYLSQISLRVFRAGLKHELVDRKWPAFEEAWHGFDPARCAAVYDEDLEVMLEDRRLIRHLGKLRSVRSNAQAVLTIAREHGSFGAWLAAWPGAEIVGLWDALAKRFAQLGGNSAPYFLRMVGKDTFILTDSVSKALVQWRVAASAPLTKSERTTVQTIFNAWSSETGRPLCQLSQILALSVD